MKILLLGDYSGVHKNLRDGLRALGYQCDLATTGDGFKKISASDLPIPASEKSMIRKFEKLIFPFTGLRQMLNYDVVQIINCNVFGGWQFRYNYNYLLLSQIKKHSHKMFMMACGEDHYVFSKRDSLRYNPFDEAIMQGETIGATYTDRRYVENNIRVAELVDGIIPGMYEYADRRSYPYIY